MKVVIIFLFIAQCVFGAQIKVLNEKAVANEPLSVVISTYGKDARFEDINSLGGYEIIEKKELVNTVFLNKDIVYEKRLILTIVPQQSFTIEPVHIKNAANETSTKPLFVEVSPPEDIVGGNYFIKLNISKQKLYLYEPATVTMRLFENKQKRLLDLLYTPPSKSGFFVKQLGQEKSYVEGEFIVHEVRYLYYPQKEGNLTIQGAQARIGIPVRAKDMFGETVVPKHRVIESQDIDLEVAPLPEKVDLVGNVKLESSIGSQKVKANEPVFLEFVLSGEANFDDFKGFAVDIENAVVYEGKTQVTPKGFTQSFSIVSNESFQIPQMQVRYFDTADETVKVLQTDAYSVEVATSKIKTDEKTVVVTKEVVSVHAVLIAFIAGVFSVFGAFFIKYKMKSKEKIKKTSLQELVPFCDKDDVFDVAKAIYSEKRENKKPSTDKKTVRETIKKYKKEI